LISAQILANPSRVAGTAISATTVTTLLQSKKRDFPSSRKRAVSTTSLRSAIQAHLFTPDSASTVIQHYGVCHEDFVWQIRQEPGVYGAFEKVYGTEDLIVSFDAINVSFPKFVSALV
jgi:hypothetical protein